jgi:hypothetical protein
MERRNFLTGAAAVAADAITLPALAWAQEKSKLMITGIRLVNLMPLGTFKPMTAGAHRL